MWNKLNQSILGGDEEEEEDELLYDTQDLCSLTHLQRVYAFAACLLTALVLMLLSLIVFANPIKFALLFTFGNLMAIGSTAFLIGPTQQTRMMFDPVRMYATTIYFGCVVLALICALLLRCRPVVLALICAVLIHSKVLTLIVIICEICAFIWYSLSYIPFARRIISELTIRLCDTEI